MRHLRILAAALICSAGCGLLLPYPGAGAALDAFSLPDSGIPGAEDPLTDPPTDESVSVINNLDDVVAALPGASFPIDLNFQAPDANVVGGGIRFEGSDEVQWTLLDKVMDQQTGDVQFAYVVDPNACDDVSNLCHEVAAEEFVITSRGGEFHVSEAVDVTVVLQCATCSSTSCIESLPAGACQECAQPEACEMVFENCYGEGAPWEGTSEANVFEEFLGPDGSMWQGLHTCAEGEALCDIFLEDDRCEF